MTNSPKSPEEAALLSGQTAFCTAYLSQASPGPHALISIKGNYADPVMTPTRRPHRLQGIPPVHGSGGGLAYIRRDATFSLVCSLTPHLFAAADTAALLPRARSPTL